MTNKTAQLMLANIMERRRRLMINAPTCHDHGLPFALIEATAPAQWHCFLCRFGLSYEPEMAQRPEKN